MAAATVTFAVELATPFAPVHCSVKSYVPAAVSVSCSWPPSAVALPFQPSLPLPPDAVHAVALCAVQAIVKDVPVTAVAAASTATLTGKGVTGMSR
jgi:hypothetical protein